MVMEHAANTHKYEEAMALDLVASWIELMFHGWSENVSRKASEFANRFNLDDDTTADLLGLAEATKN